MATMTKEDLDARIKEVIGEELAEFREQQEQKSRDEPSAELIAALTGGNKQTQEEQPEKGIRLARWIRAVTLTRGDTDKAADIARDKWGDEQLSKALVESTLEEGGALAPAEYVAEVIELLRARSVVRSLGTPSMPMNGSSLAIPYLSQGTSASYVGEMSNIPTSEAKFGMLQLSAKKLAALVPLSNDLLRDASAAPQVDALVRDDLTREMSLREDLAFIRDDGTENTPMGIKYWVENYKSSHTFARTQASSPSTLAEKTADLMKAVRLVEEENVAMSNPGWIMTPRTKWDLMQERDSNGNFAFKEEMTQGTLLGFPFRTTTQIPENLGTNSDESEIYFADLSGAVIAENTSLLIEPFPGGAYHDGSNVVSGISTDSTVIRSIARHDFGARYRGNEFVVITEVDWGA